LSLSLVVLHLCAVLHGLRFISGYRILLMRLLRELLLVIACLTGAPAILTAQDDSRDEIEDRRSARQIADSAEIAVLARTLAGGGATDSARAAALYEWIARHVRYDARAFFRGDDGHETAEEVYRRRMALCGGYVALYERLAREVGLRAIPITGYAKGVDYVFGRSTKKPNHAWLALHLGGEWRLIDPTWGAGVINGKTFEPRFTWEYFLVSPDELILSHYPADEAWQLVAAPLARADFERMRAVPRTLLGVGFSAEAIRAAALTPGVTDFPLVGLLGRHVHVVHAPVAGTIPAAASVVVEVEWPGATEVALVTNGKWTQLSRSGNRFRGEAAAAGSTLQVVGRTGEGKAPYHTLLHYRVAGGRPRASSK
jgi:hypothetical protein